MEWLADPVWGGISGLIALLLFLAPICNHLIKKRKMQKNKSDHKKFTNDNEINSVVKRFIILLESHGIERTQIPRFFKNKYEINFNDVSSNSKLLLLLNNSIIETVCKCFNVRPDWLEGKDVPMYETSFFDKSPNGFIEFLHSLKTQYEYVEGFAIKSPEDRLEKKKYHSEIALVFRAKIEDHKKFREEGIYKYFPCSEIYYWGYERTRLQLKAYVLIAWQFEIPIYGYELPEKEITGIREGLLFPGPLIERSHRVSWHPDDYIFNEEESYAVKDGKEALKARNYLSNMRWMEKLISLTGEINAPLKS